MNRLQHPSNNGVLGAPDMPVASCDALPVTHVLVDGHPMVVSYWQPDAAELAHLNAGQPVMLWVWGSDHAPVALGVEPRGPDTGGTGGPVESAPT